MPDHVGVGKVENTKVVVLELLDHFVHDFWGTHFRLEVVGGDFGRWHDVAVLSFVGRLLTSIKEVGDVWVFLRLSDAHLRFASCCDNFTEHVLKVLRAVGYRHSVGLIIFSQGDVVHLRSSVSIKAVKFWLEKGIGNLSGTVSTEVEPDDNITIIDAAFVVLTEGHRQQELIGFVLLVFFSNSFTGEDVFGFAFPFDNGIPCDLVTVPALVTVHRVVAPDHRGNTRTRLSNGILHILKVVLTTGRRGVAPIGDGVNHDLVTAIFFGHFTQCNKMILMAVNATV